MLAKPMTNIQILGNWLKGIAGSTIAALSTFQEQLDFWTRYTFVIFGGFVTILSLVKIIKNWKK